MKLPVIEPDSEDINSPLLNIQQAAEMLGVSKNTIRRWCRIGILECIRINARGDRRFSCESLQKILIPKRTGRPKGTKTKL
ncbi:MAG: helix-turn-helix domain-containing protein [Calditrichaeota bacterium]|nr:helix-turn-helix domain-containing protein [Calditrichota bacterium]MCB9367658.1 helix-turn-helix domain-containing protein [Calditrichota bacterium]